MSENVSTYGRPREPEISWSAVAAGAVVALATSIVLTLLAAGFGWTFGFGGLASRSSLAAFTPEFGAAAVAVQVLAAGFGGYVAGRLRHAWRYAHVDEAHFRDTAHGLLSWALSTVVAIVLAVWLLIPYAEQIDPAGAAAVTGSVDAVRASNIAAQASLFTAVGMMLSAFIAAVAARIGGLRNEEMQTKAPS
jgi:hypothetical protein